MAGIEFSRELRKVHSISSNEDPFPDVAVSFLSSVAGKLFAGERTFLSAFGFI